MNDAAATRYDATALERQYGELWETNGCFNVRLDGAEPYALMMPPPNVTGTLHLGHALDNTLPDILVRRARMQGKDALYQPGRDHASIAVHVVLERQWAKEGKTRFDFTREEFLEKAWAWKDHSAGVITGQLRRLGISCDWQNERFTMDVQYSKAVNKVFIDLYNKGLIYRGQRLVNWDPKMQTAVSDLEVKHKQVNGNLWHVRYKFADGGTYDGKDGIEIATTRPETILADGAIAIHPDDPRAKDLLGRKVVVPMVDRQIEIIADTMVDPAFGSGMVKITAAHDFNDFEFYKRHKDDHEVPVIDLLTPDGKMNKNCPPAYVGLDRFAARKKIVADLEELGQMIKVEPHAHNVGHAERDDTILEPYLTWQWYVSCDAIAKRCLKAADDGEVVFVNERDGKVYRHWLENIQDWCISRQLWWGHRIPAWYRDKEGTAEPEIHVGEAPVGEGWRQDEDILDTWFSSALWPFVTQGWPENTERLRAFYPNHAIMSGRDILFFWLVRMMMMGLELTDKVPFRTIYTHGLILDEHGQKMSKSKGNVVDPMDLIEKYGVDALRLTMASIASSEDMRFSEAKVEQNRNFCTKLWNAARFMSMQGVIWTAAERGRFDVDGVKHPVNRWMVASLKNMIMEVDSALDGYAFNQAAQALYHFSWGTWCDWYLEFTKALLQDPVYADETKLVMGWGFDTLLRVLHPVTPYITEELWSNLTQGGEDQFIMLQRWPVVKALPQDDAATALVEKVISLVSGIRQARMMHRITPKERLAIWVKGTEGQTGIDATVWALVQRLANVGTLQHRTDVAKAGEAVVVCGDVEMILPLEGLIDFATERARLQKDMEKQQAEAEKIEELLGRESFVARAPADVLEMNRSRLSELKEQLGKMQALLNGPYAVNS